MRAPTRLTIIGMVLGTCALGILVYLRNYENARSEIRLSIQRKLSSSNSVQILNGFETEVLSPPKDYVINRIGLEVGLTGWTAEVFVRSKGRVRTLWIFGRDDRISSMRLAKEF